MSFNNLLRDKWRTSYDNTNGLLAILKYSYNIEPTPEEILMMHLAEARDRLDCIYNPTHTTYKLYITLIDQTLIYIGKYQFANSRV